MSGIFSCLPGSLPLKVCGLTRARDVRLCLDLGARFTGFVFVRQSPRYIAPEAVAAMPSGGEGAPARVGVFAGQSVNEVLRIMETARLDYAQLHGGEDVKFCRSVGAERVIKVLWPQGLSGPDLLSAECERFASGCAFFLLDAGKQGGGSGERLPWAALRGFRPPRPWILAGGLGPDNLEEAVKTCLPWAVDCNSGLEDAPGVKNIGRLEAVASILFDFQIKSTKP
ncbi:MAG: phosphoribosylanthranilate isomerase [Deltaproteobacteria bacterium]|jgi:phosphoribosylanthranilate isomerase|nr:phosphoribosylanthranilate isomerase [Deltaproteobacteria bacterium]